MIEYLLLFKSTFINNKWADLNTNDSFYQCIYRLAWVPLAVLNYLSNLMIADYLPRWFHASQPVPTWLGTQTRRIALPQALPWEPAAMPQVAGQWHRSGVQDLVRPWAQLSSEPGTWLGCVLPACFQNGVTGSCRTPSNPGAQSSCMVVSSPRQTEVPPKP